MAIATIFHIAIIHITVITECLCSSEMVRICYFNAVARYRNGDSRFDSYNIDFSLCTHYIYGYAKLDHAAYTILSIDPSKELGNTGAYRDFTTRDANTADNPKRLLSVGGPSRAIDIAFEEMVTQYQPNHFMTFSNNAIDFLRTHNFGGLDIDWQYPSDYNMHSGLVTLLRNLRQAFDLDTTGEKLLLTLKCTGLYSQNMYQVTDLSRYADYVILAVYNFTSQFPYRATFGSPLYGQDMTVNSTVREWFQRGLPANKTVVGITAMGRFATLTDARQYIPNSPIHGGNPPGMFYCIPGGLAYPEVCEIRGVGNDFFDHNTRMNYVANGTLWVGYEGKLSIGEKIAWMKSLNIRGVMFSFIDEDDFNGTHCKDGKYPLLNFIKSETTLSNQTLPLQTTTRTPDVGQTTASPLPSAGQPSTQSPLLSTDPTTVSGLTTQAFVDKTTFYNFYGIILLIFLVCLAILLIACMNVLVHRDVVPENVHGQPE